jgi:FRG domain
MVRNMNESDGLSGQWHGTFSGSSNGTITINIDETASNYRGLAYLCDVDTKLPGSAAGFTMPSKDNEFSFRTEWILAIDRLSGQGIPLESIALKYPGAAVPKYADVKGSLEKDALKLSWITDLGTAHSCTLPRSKAGQPSELPISEQHWGIYKERRALDVHKRYLYRGQNRPWRLRTSFHRTRRADLQRFINEDIPALHRQLSARTKHVFNLQIGDENGAFFNLVQHHGYPTPLLDWTYSPYVAAFFAYRNITNKQAAKAAPADRVRILVFDQAEWRRDFIQIPQLILPFGFHVSLGEFIAIENERMIPQQATSMITNIDDIEGYIQSKQSAAKKYLWAIDLPMSDRRQAVSELSYMGITAGSMFPGLDGACEELRERNFEI